MIRLHNLYEFQQRVLAYEHDGRRMRSGQDYGKQRKKQIQLTDNKKN